MLEYASSRTTCRCWRATRFPIVMVRMASTAKIGVQSSAVGAKPTKVICRRPANPAALEATDRNAATGMGDPS